MTCKGRLGMVFFCRMAAGNRLSGFWLLVLVVVAMAESFCFDELELASGDLRTTPQILGFLKGG